MEVNGHAGDVQSEANEEVTNASTEAYAQLVATAEVDKVQMRVQEAFRGFLQISLEGTIPTFGLVEDRVLKEKSVIEILESMEGLDKRASNPITITASNSTFVGEFIPNFNPKDAPRVSLPTDHQVAGLNGQHRWEAGIRKLADLRSFVVQLQNRGSTGKGKGKGKQTEVAEKEEYDIKLDVFSVDIRRYWLAEVYDSGM